MQFSNSLRLGKVGSLLDSDVRAFAATSGATDLGGLDDLAKYVKAQGLWSNFRLYPMKSAQNAGSGLTVHGLGSLTANNMTLVNSPTWGASGIDYNGSNQYGAISDFLGSGTITLFCRVTKNDQTTTDSAVVSQWQPSGDDRSFILYQAGTSPGDNWRLNRSSDGTAANTEIYSGSKSGIGSDSCMVAQWVNSGTRSLWTNKTSQTLTLESALPVTSRKNSAASITVGAFLNGASITLPASMTGHAFAIITGSITTTQRETITDLINAL